MGGAVLISQRRGGEGVGANVNLAKVYHSDKFEQRQYVCLIFFFCAPIKLSFQMPLPPFSDSVGAPC